MQEELKHLETLTGLLNEEADKLNGVIKGLEEKLTKMRVGIPGWLLPVAAGVGDDGIEFGWRIGYGKTGGAWRILAQRVSMDSEPLDPAMPILKAPRSVRTEQALRLGELLRGLINRAEVMILSVQAARHGLAAALEDDLSEKTDA